MLGRTKDFRVLVAEDGNHPAIRPDVEERVGRGIDLLEV
jgi:hypothetical protein